MTSGWESVALGEVVKPTERREAPISGKAYRQVGNAFPPPVAKAVAQNLKIALSVQKVFAVRNAA